MKVFVIIAGFLFSVSFAGIEVNAKQPAIDDIKSLSKSLVEKFSGKTLKQVIEYNDGSNQQKAKEIYFVPGNNPFLYVKELGFLDDGNPFNVEKIISDGQVAVSVNGGDWTSSLFQTIDSELIKQTYLYHSPYPFLEKEKDRIASLNKLAKEQKLSPSTILELAEAGKLTEEVTSKISEKGQFEFDFGSSKYQGSVNSNGLIKELVVSSNSSQVDSFKLVKNSFAEVPPFISDKFLTQIREGGDLSKFSRQFNSTPGYGIQFQNVQGIIVIRKVFPNGPFAELEKFGDGIILYEVNGVKVRGMEEKEVSELFRQSEKVAISIITPTSREMLKFEAEKSIF